MKNFKRLCLPTILLYTVILFSCKKTEIPKAIADQNINSKIGSAAPNLINSSSFRVIGYQNSESALATDIQLGNLTHVIYASLYLNYDGSLQALANPAKLQNLVNQKRRFPGLYVLVSITEKSGEGGNFSDMASNPAAMSTFVQNVYNFLDQNNLDGVEINWQYPTRGNGDPSDRDNLTRLLRDLRSSLRANGKLLVVQAGGSASQVQSSYDVISILPNIDWVAIQAYNDNPLLAVNFASYANANSSLTIWSNAGLPKAKSVIILPFFGKALVALPLLQSSYKNIISNGGNPMSDNFGIISYNGIPTVKSKTNLAFDSAGGVAALNVDDDATGSSSLLNAIHEVVVARN